MNKNFNSIMSNFAKKSKRDSNKKFGATSSKLSPKHLELLEGIFEGWDVTYSSNPSKHAALLKLLMDNVDKIVLAAKDINTKYFIYLIDNYAAEDLFKVGNYDRSRYPRYFIEIDTLDPRESVGNKYEGAILGYGNDLNSIMKLFESANAFNLDSLINKAHSSFKLFGITWDEMNLRSECDKLFKSDIYKSVNAAMDKPEFVKARGKSIWDGDTREHQVINLLAKAVYRILNDGDDVFNDYLASGYTECSLANDILAREYKLPAAKSLTELYNMLNEMLTRINSGNTHKPDSGLERILRRSWEQQAEREREHERKMWESEWDGYRFSK